MLDIQEFQDGQIYSEETQNAVLYGYRYRIKAEECEENGIRCNFSLSETSPILYWLAQLVISGVAFDLIKKYASKLWNRLMKMKVEIPKDVEIILLDDDELKKFVTYVDEFNGKKPSFSPKVASYIKEEIVANYLGAKAGELGRILTPEEILKYTKEAFQYADELTNIKQS